MYRRLFEVSRVTYFAKMPLILAKSSVQAEIKIALVFPPLPSHRMPPKCPQGHFFPWACQMFVNNNVNSYLSLMECFMPSKGGTSQWSLLYNAVQEICLKVRGKTICEFVLWATLAFSYSIAKAKLSSWFTQISFNLDPIWKSDIPLITL